MAYRARRYAAKRSPNRRTRAAPARRVRGSVRRSGSSRTVQRVELVIRNEASQGITGATAVIDAGKLRMLSNAAPRKAKF